MKILILPMLLILFFSGCAKWSATSLGKGNSYMKLDAKNRAVVILEGTNEHNFSQYKICAEPLPDGISTFVVDIAGTHNNDINTSLGFQRNIVNTYSSLKTERIMEKSLHRLCELSMNTNLSTVDIREMYIQAMVVAGTVASVELKKIEAVQDIAVSTITPANKQILFNYLDTIK